MPVERARSLRWGWEFLWELQSATSLTSAQLTKIRNILRHYPSTLEIDQWANERAGFGVLVQTSVFDGLYLEREDHQKSGTEPQLGVPLDVYRGPTTPQERLQALFEALELFAVDFRMCSHLTPEQRRTLLFVSRHFPQSYELNGMTRLEIVAERAAPGARVWLEEISGSSLAGL